MEQLEIKVARAGMRAASLTTSEDLLQMRLRLGFYGWACLFQPPAAEGPRPGLRAAALPTSEEILAYKLRHGGIFPVEAAQPMAARAPRVVEDMKNPFIGDDGKDYYSVDALRAANRAHFEATHHYISCILGRNYPPTHQGYEQMKQDESAYWNNQIINIDDGNIINKINFKDPVRY